MVLSNSQMEYILHLFLGKEKITLIALNMLSLDVIFAFADGGHKRSLRIKGLSKPPYQDSLDWVVLTRTICIVVVLI